MKYSKMTAKMTEFPPEEVTAAAELVGRWFAEHNVTSWSLGPCAAREDAEKCDQLELDNAHLTNRINTLQAFVDAHNTRVGLDR